MFRKNNIIILIPLLAFMFSCTDRGYEDVNKNINEITDPKPIHLLNSAFGIFNSSSTWSTLAELSHQYAETSNQAGKYYRFDTGVWGNYKANLNLNDVINRTKDSQDETDRMTYALAKIFRAYAFQKITDCYGDVPFSEAGVIDDAGAFNVTPKYDKQEEIYTATLADLDEAIDIIGDKSLTLALGSADRVYGGDVQLWKKFANSLRLRMAMRIRFVDEAKALEVLKKVWTQPLIDSPEEAADYENFDEPGYYYYGYVGLKAETRTNASKMMVDFLKSNSDPRLYSYALPVQQGPMAGQYAGLPNGYDGGTNRDNFSYAGKVSYQKTLPTINLSYSEVCFLKAEAYLFGLGVAKNESEAQMYYAKGIETSLNFWRRPDTFVKDGAEVSEPLYSEQDVTDFMSSSAASLSGTQEEKFKMIAEQKWASLMTNWVEAYAEMRRTGYPAVKPRVVGEELSLGDTQGQWPRRAPYPDSEMLNNQENYDKASAATDGNSMTHRVWWDVR
ncbi:hypothetical protein FUAX_19860 [Fulvitalea axinellae]|uniref:SusD/RagB family nutrient-binding outer membrane lipoprotein n=1 Tax=Fulvitalea axinellae TaxID=1182444 RepID=A0AAU9CBQ3_9BACT|nr:hypothetical protein FUAX_19860 [Fulvitalea axinellae]